MTAYQAERPSVKLSSRYNSSDSATTWEQFCSLVMAQAELLERIALYGIKLQHMALYLYPTGQPVLDFQ